MDSICAEFTKDKLLFNHEDPSCFYQLQWSNNLWFYFGYRILFLSYMITWIIIGVFTLDNPLDYVTYFSYIETICISVYFFNGFLVSIFEMSAYNSKSSSKALWFHKTAWIFQCLCFTSSCVVSSFYWILLAADDPTRDSPLNIHIHLIALLIMLIDIFMIKFPVRILHFIYCSAFALLYILYTFLLHISGVSSKLYPFLDWSKGFTGPLILAVLLLIGSLIPQLLNFALFKLRSFLFFKYNDKSY